MTEARVTCTCSQIGLPDLDIALARDQVVFVNEEAARASKDLNRARAAGAVLVAYVQRFQLQREKGDEAPLAHFVSRVLSAFMPPLPEPEQTLVFDPDDMAERVARRLNSREPVSPVPIDMQKICSEVNRQFQEVRAAVKADLRAELMEALKGIQVAGGNAAKMSDDDPVFIPSSIGEDLKAEVGVSEKVSATGVGEAVAALAAMRAGRNKKKSDG